MEYTLNNFIGDTLYVLERQDFGTLEFDIPSNTLSSTIPFMYKNMIAYRALVIPKK